MRQRITHAGTYLGVYGLCTALDVAVVSITRRALDLPLVLAVAFGFTTNVAAGFVLGRLVVFPRSRTRLATASWRYALLVGVNVLVGVGGVATAVAHGARYLVARLVTSGLLVVVNYGLMRWWVFGARRSR